MESGDFAHPEKKERFSQDIPHTLTDLKRGAVQVSQAGSSPSTVPRRHFGSHGLARMDRASVTMELTAVSRQRTSKASRKKNGQWTESRK